MAIYRKWPLLLIFLILGCEAEPEAVTLGVSVPETTAPVYTLIKQAMIEHKEEYGVEILWNDVRDKNHNQDGVSVEHQQIRKMLEAGIRVLVINPIKGTATYPIVREAARWNVPVISLDRMLISMPIRGHIAVNEIGLGETAAQYVVEQIRAKGNVLVLEGSVGVESIRNIAIGIYRILDEYDQIRVFSRISTSDAQAALDLTNRMLKNYAGNIQAIIAVDSVIAVGAVQGVQLHGLNDQVVTVGVGAGEEACQQIIMKQHDAEVDLMPYQRGLEALKAAVAALNDEPFSYDAKLPTGEIYTKTKYGPIRLITSANYLEIKRMWPDLFPKK